MSRLKDYFPLEGISPPPLETEVERRVRFEEVDLVGIVWHGRYASYFEDGRIAFGDRYGLSYRSFLEQKTVAPIVQMHIDYKVPLRFDEVVLIKVNLHWSEAARLNFSYRIEKHDGVVAVTGYTVQLLTDVDGNVLLVAPDWILNFRKKWMENQW